jgi:hypothetical protein
VQFYLSAARRTVEAAVLVLPRMSKAAAVEQIERFFSFPQLPARSKRAVSTGSSTMKAPAIRVVAARIKARAKTIAANR